jgi:hypothetical protein
MSCTGSRAKTLVAVLGGTLLLVVGMAITTARSAFAQGAAAPPNLLSAMNPSFDRAHDGWSFSHAAESTQAWAEDGPGGSSMRVTGSVANNDVSAYSSFVPVAAGGTYSARITGKIDSALQGGMRLRIEWWNETSQLGGDTGSPVAGTAGTVSIASVTAVAPTGATLARLRVFDSGTGTWDVYLDAAMIVEGGVPSSYYAELPPNLLSELNPSFERGLDDWSFSHSASPSTAWAYDRNGVSSAHVTGSVSNGEVSAYSSLAPVTAGKTYSGRITGRLDSSLQEGFRLQIEWWDDTGPLGSVTGSRAAGAEATASATAVAPTGATGARLRAYDGGAGTWDVHLDAALLVEGGVPSHYYAGADRPPRELEDLPVPTLGVEVNVAPVPGSGPVLIGVDGEFVPLEEAEQIPIGSVINAIRGSVRLVTAVGPGPGTQAGTFSGGVFQVLQSPSRGARGLTVLRLTGASFDRCRRAPGRSRRTIRRLHSSTNGRFRTLGRVASATHRGRAAWLTADRCDGTLTQVSRGSVVVRNLRRRERVRLRPGGTFLASASRRGRCRRPRCKQLGIVSSYERGGSRAR